MNKSVKKLTRAALLTALGSALLYVSAVIPSGRIAVIAISGLMTAAAVIHCGLYQSAAVFVITSLLGALVAPLKSSVILYAVFFGYYPIAKSLLERLKNRALEWILKLLVFNAAFAGVWFLGQSLFLTGEIPEIPEKLLIPVFVLMNLVFAAYDLGVSRLISFYISRISKHID